MDTLVENNEDPLVDNEDPLVDHEDGEEGRKTAGKKGCKGSQVGDTDVQRSDLLEGRLCLKREKVCEILVPILAFLFSVSPDSGDGRGKIQQKVKTLICK